MTLPIENPGTPDVPSLNKAVSDQASQKLSESLGPDDWSKLSLDEQKRRLAQVAAIGGNDTQTIPGAKEQWQSQTPAEQAAQNQRMYQAASQFPINDTRSSQMPPVAPDRGDRATQAPAAGYDNMNSWLNSISNDRAPNNYYGQQGNPMRIQRPQDTSNQGRSPDVLPPVGLPQMPGQINAPDAYGHRQFPIQHSSPFMQTPEQGGLSPIQQMQGMRPDMLPPQMQPNMRYDQGQRPGNAQLVPVTDQQGRTYYVPATDLMQPQSMRPAQPGQMGIDQSPYVQQQLQQYERQLAAQQQQALYAQQMQMQQQMMMQQQMRYNQYGGGYYNNGMGMGMGMGRMGFGGMGGLGGLGNLAYMFRGMGGGRMGGMGGMGGIMNFLRFI